jgi:hypothetical protein
VSGLREEGESEHMDSQPAHAQLSVMRMYALQYLGMAGTENRFFSLIFLINYLITGLPFNIFLRPLGYIFYNIL